MFAFKQSFTFFKRAVPFNSKICCSNLFLFFPQKVLDCVWMLSLDHLPEPELPGNKKLFHLRHLGWPSQAKEDTPKVKVNGRLKLKTRPKQLLGSLLLYIPLPIEEHHRNLINIECSLGVSSHFGCKTSGTISRCKNWCSLGF